MKPILVRWIVVLCLLASAAAIVPPRSAEAAAPPVSELPASLQDAFFAAASEPFVSRGGAYSGEHNDLTYNLAPAGLQTQSGGLSWAVSLQAIGKGTEVQDVQSPEIVQGDNGLEYRRGRVAEWYRNLPVGVEQGFTINEVPQGKGELALHLDLNTDIAGVMDTDARGLSFTASDGRVLRYDHLKAYDANGAQLDTRFLYTPSQIVIQVNEREAVYPIKIDPLIYLETKVSGIDSGADDGFGTSVALSGDTALVGARFKDIGVHSDQGAAYVFVRSAGVWAFAAELATSDGLANDYFGMSVALSGDTALVGAPLAYVGGHAYQGAAYVFVKPAGGWASTSSFSAKLTASAGGTHDELGWSVALSGDTALVSAPEVSVGNGVAYVYVKPSSGWVTTATPTAQLTASDGGGSDAFGTGVALSGNTALVGAPSATIGEIPQGAAYVFVKPVSGWANISETAKLQAWDGAAYDDFGRAVALSGDTALIGSQLDDVDYTDEGSAYIFVKPTAGWGSADPTQAKLTASDRGDTDSFGLAVALWGSTAVVGACQANVGENEDQGAAYVFVRPPGGWEDMTENLKLTASDGALSDVFGNSVAVSGSTALVGAPLVDYPGKSNQGAAYFYEAYRSDADLGVSVGRNPATAKAGDTVFLTASVMNYGPSAATAVLVSTPLPSGLTYVASSPARGSYDPSTGSWNIGSLPIGAGAILTLRTTVNARTGPTLTFTASSLALDTNNTNNSASTNLTVLVPMVSLTPTAENFGSVLVGESEAQDFEVTNGGGAALHLGKLTLSENGKGDGKGDFRISDDACSSVTLLPSASCSLTVSFAPAHEGTWTGSLRVPSDAITSPDSASLRGTGVVERLVNGGFDSYVGASKIPKGWTAAQFGPGDGKDSTTKEEGPASVRMVGQVGKTKTLAQAVSVHGAAGVPITLSFWVKTTSVPSAGSCMGQVILYNGAIAKKTKTVSCPTGTTSDFVWKTSTFTAPVAFTSIKVIFTYGKASGTVWFDTASLLK